MPNCTLFFMRPAWEVTPDLAADADGAMPTVLADGTFWTEDEMQRPGLSKKSAADMGHLPQAPQGHDFPA